MIHQTEFHLSSYSRGFHLITHEVEQHLPNLPKTGILNLFIKHTSAALSINENADPDVMGDLNRFIDQLIPENHPTYRHIMEGADDMPAHIKASLIGFSIQIPISDHRLNLGIWQGIVLCEFRNGKRSRKVIATIYGE